MPYPAEVGEFVPYLHGESGFPRAKFEDLHLQKVRNYSQISWSRMWATITGATEKGTLSAMYLPNSIL